jgi:hypothetical protein
MSMQTLKGILQGEKLDALSSNHSELADQRSKAMDFYLGNMDEVLPPPTGRSSAVSRDVFDTVEGMLPTLLDIFFGSDEVVKFDPVGPEDVQAAQQETDTCLYVFMQQNNGYLTGYQAIKDALISKTGIVKVWWEQKETESEETYYKQPEDVMGLLAMDENLSVVEHTANKDGTHDVTISTSRDESQCCVEAVPPEEFGISRHARCDVQDAPYLFHEPANGKTERELVALGYDPEQIKELPSYASPSDSASSEQVARDTVLENNTADHESTNKPNRRIRITEHYVWLDYKGDGVARRYRVVTGGEDSTILERDGKPDIEEIEWWPFAVGTPIIQPHRFFGISMADVTMDIQLKKTALERGGLDNVYFTVNPRPEVAQEGSTDNTLDDLMVWRPGAPIRVKTPGTVNWQVVPDITGSIYPALQYQDAVREWRTGVSKVSVGLDANALQNTTATATMQQYNAAQARLKLVAKNLAETLFTDLFWLIHSTVRKYGEQEMTVMLRNQWVPVNPREWKERKDMTINVGLGRGTRLEESAIIEKVIAMQAAAAQNGILPMTPKQFHNSAAKYCALNNIKNVDDYFPDPGDAPMPEPQPDPQIVKAQMDSQLRMQEMQGKAEIEKVQAEADIATQQLKTQSEIALAERKFELERELKLIEHAQKMQESKQSMLISGVQAASKANGKDEDGKSTGPDPAMIDRIFEMLKPQEGPKEEAKPRRKRLKKVGPGEYISEEMN